MRGFENYIPEGHSQIFDVPVFTISKYPITNAQYARFIRAGGYHEKKWWTAAGWEARGQGWNWDSEKVRWVPTGKPWTEPRYWGNRNANGAEQPVVGVSWYEATAFCGWLSEASGEMVALPTEQQWQCAAQGDDGRTYPWGNKWDGTRCNNSKPPQESDQTTPVQEYEGRGDSPFGVVDLIGNAWEWCLTDYQTGSNKLDGAGVRVLRGGSFSNAGDNFLVTFRLRLEPYDRGLADAHGFRCVRLAEGNELIIHDYLSSVRVLMLPAPVSGRNIPEEDQT
jgi:formylglycine-generating enzyme required for sulfatase activity